MTSIINRRTNEKVVPAKEYPLLKNVSKRQENIRKYHHQKMNFHYVQPSCKDIIWSMPKWAFC